MKIWIVCGSFSLYLIFWTYFYFQGCHNQLIVLFWNKWQPWKSNRTSYSSQGRASGGREMVELGHPPGNETARSIPGKLAGNLNFQDWTIKWEGNLISSSIRRHVRLFIWIFFHFWFIKHKPWLLLSVKHKIWSRGSIQNTPGGFADLAGKIWDV